MKTDITVDYGTDGGITFWYHLAIPGWSERHQRQFEKVYSNFSGVVPADIAGQDKKTIRTYVRKQVAYEIRKKRQDDQAHDRKLEQVNFPISTMFQEKLLRGQVVWSKEKDGAIIKLLSPIQSEVDWRRGESFGGAMAGYRQFTEDISDLDPDGRKDAEQHLVQLYQSAFCKHKPGIEKLR